MGCHPLSVEEQAMAKAPFEAEWIQADTKYLRPKMEEYAKK